MRGRGDVCHVELVDTDGHVEPCHKPQAGTITTRDEYGRTVTYPVCEQCMSAAMEGLDDATNL